MCADRRDRASITEAELNDILETAWESAARQNPMLLAKLRPDYSFERLRELVRDCLAQGMSVAEVRDHALRELIRSAKEDRQPQHKCEQPNPMGRQP
jgi:hypothetical protein